MSVGIPDCPGVRVFIHRVQVEAEGFLANLDVEFAQGLNVIIGARGTGKTSLIELIRFALGAGAFTGEAATRGRQQAIAVLDGGAVTVTVNDGGALHTITRSASGHVTSTAGSSFSCTVLAQNEMEVVGSQAVGRLHLIDRFRADRAETGDALLTLQAQVSSLTTMLHTVLREASSMNEHIESLAPVTEELAAARAEQERLLANAKATHEDHRHLLDLQHAGQSTAKEESVIEYAAQLVATLVAATEQLAVDAGKPLPTWPTGNPDLLAQARQHLAAGQSLIHQARDSVVAAQQAVDAARGTAHDRRRHIDEDSRRLRQSLEALQAGIGLATRRVAELEERQGQLVALRARLDDQQRTSEHLSRDRNEYYDQLDDARSRIFDERRRAAEGLNEHLSPWVRVQVTRSENVEDYRSSLIAALRGSGLHYNTLASRITESVSPLELAIWTEHGDTRALSQALEIPADRAAAVIAALRKSGVADVISSVIEDGVSLSLLDGREYKASDRLSIGQRCTVVLPVLLGRHGDPLLVDQPEDHLDNAYIASTLVTALLRREPNDQFIFSSHNANIPVLGEAQRVIVMDSDGDRGFVRSAGPLDAPDIVSAVTRIMEGGADAFATRARFYVGQASHLA